MFEKYKNVHLMVLFALFFLGISAGLAFAIDMTVDGKDDAGFYAGQGAFARFVDTGPPNNLLLNVLPTDPPFLSEGVARTFAYAQNISDWSLQSAGNIWSATDPIVGESLSGLHAGTYRITPIDGAYMYDSWGWDPSYRYQYWWELHIRADKAYENGQLVNSLDEMLGSSVSQQSAGLAFQMVQNKYLDITLAEGGSLNFWIWDWNSVDNSGSLSFSVTQVPEPATLLFLIMGLPFLVRRVRS